MNPKFHNSAEFLSGMVNAISSVLCLCSEVPSGVASLSFDEMAAGSSAAGTTVLTVRSDETGSTRRVEDPQIHLLGAKTSTMVPDEGAENVTSGARSPLGRTHYKSGRDFGVEELEGPSQTMVQPPTQFATYFDPLFTVNEADEDLFTQAQDQKKVKEDEGYRRPTEKEKSAGSKTMNEVGTAPSSKGLGADIVLDVHICATPTVEKQPPPQRPGSVSASPSPANEL